MSFTVYRGNNLANSYELNHLNLKNSELSLELSFDMYILKWVRDKFSLVSVKRMRKIFYRILSEY